MSRKKIYLASAAIFSIFLTFMFPERFRIFKFESEMPKTEEKADKTPDAENSMLLPDLRIPEAETIYVSEETHFRFLRYSTHIDNIGDGPLEMIGIPEESQIRAVQNISKKDGGHEERLVGNLIFHPGHDHWHFENMAIFKLFSISEGGSIENELASSEKISFCLFDSEPIRENIPNKPEQKTYPECNPNIQGISVGWSDKYAADLDGQRMDISGIPDGRYAFYSEIDPDNLIMEKDETNNITISYIEIKDGKVSKKTNLDK